MAGKLVTFGHPSFEVPRRGQGVDGLVTPRSDGPGQIEGRVAAHVRESHVTILTGDATDGKVVTC